MNTQSPIPCMKPCLSRIAPPILPAVLEQTARQVFEELQREDESAALNGREERALKLALEGHVTHKSGRIFSVRSEDGQHCLPGQPGEELLHLPGQPEGQRLQAPPGSLPGRAGCASHPGTLQQSAPMQPLTSNLDLPSHRLRTKKPWRKRAWPACPLAIPA